MSAERIHLLSNEETVRKYGHPQFRGGPAITTAATLTCAELLGASAALEQLRGVIRKVARTQATVFIQGECGSGKELVARALHQQSPRAGQPFLKVDCASIPQTALDATLFGQDRPSASAAEAQHEGCVELAHGGTIVLDEVSLLSPAAQARLLRLLQKQQIERPGAEQPVQVDVRLLATTNRDLEANVKRKEFREDLFHALSIVPVLVPPLREHKEDIALLVEHFRQIFTRKHGVEVLAISPACLSALQHYDWPGNVRELQNIIERAVILCRGGGILEPAHLGLSGASTAAATFRSASGGETDDLGEVEKKHIFAVLTQCNWNRTHAAKLLGISIRTLRNKLKEYKTGDAGASEADDAPSEKLP
jgi:DNA-binding NtrC family response regulator